jgi:hypothetical protein
MRNSSSGFEGTGFRLALSVTFVMQDYDTPLAAGSGMDESRFGMKESWEAIRKRKLLIRKAFEQLRIVRS